MMYFEITFAKRYLLFVVFVGLGAAITGALRCYSCDRTNSPEECTNVVTCQEYEACSVQEALLVHGESYFWSGCEKREICSRLSESFIDNEVAIGKRHPGSRNRCAFCCNTDLCNGNCTNPINLALRKPAYQSSLSWDGYPELAVDGDTEPNYFLGHCIHTDIMPYAWWVVDLGSVYHLTSIKFFNRNDAGFDKRKFHLRFLVSNANATTLSPNSTEFTECGYYYGTSSEGRAVTIHCPRNTTGQWVRIQEEETYAFIHLCEVEVFGY